MALDLLDSSIRWSLAGAGLALIATAFALRARRGASAWVARVGAAGFVLLGAVVAERTAVWAATRAAPATTDFNEHRWILLAPWGRLGLALGAAAAVAIVALGWRASARLASPWRRAAAVGLRTGAAAAALVLFLEPAVELRQVAREPNHVAVVVDRSASMGLRDAPAGPSRAERARDILARSASTFASWADRHRVDFYTFAESLEPAAGAGAPATAPEGNATLLREALEQVRKRYDGADLAGIVVLTDGIATGRFADGASDGAARDFLRGIDAPVHAVWVGRAGLRDVAVAKLHVDEFAFVRTVVKVEAVLRTTGYGPRRVPVALTREGKLVRQKWVDLPAGAGTATVSFEFTPQRVGKFVYEIATPVSPDEAVQTNNSRAFVLRVIRDKIRVLQVAGQPSWDVRSLRRLLKRNPNVDLISFFILRTHEDVQPVPQHEMSLIPFPTQELFGEQLPSFDLIVLQNFDFLPYGIGVYLDKIREYVEGGGGLIMLGGPGSFSSGLYAGTPVARALPVKLLANNTPLSQLLDTSTFTPRLTRAGAAHPIAALRYEPADNQAAWASLPPLEGVNRVGDVVDGAVAIAVHPTLKTPSGRPMPVIAAGSYGDGRSIAVMTDSLWRWGFVAAAREGNDGRYYEKFWENAIRWAIQDPELSHLHVEADAPEYYAGAPVRLDVRLLGADYTPAAGGEVDLDIARVNDDGGEQVVASARVTVDEAGEGAHTLHAPDHPGPYRVRARAAVAGRAATAVDLFLVREGSAEFERPAATFDLLAQIADQTGGRLLVDADALPADLPFRPPRVVRVDRRADVEVWSQPWLLFAALLLLGLEWGLRQRAGTL
ncbi:MAG: hypothetical protein D6689_15455 [Deltaproteobacteria bacterium]|nr:MAG: hypothetical protein D6689_15455 [Deltaproteobacteria bacterium]